MSNAYEQIQFSDSKPLPVVPADSKTQRRATLTFTDSTSEAQTKMQSVVEKNPKHPTFKRKAIRKKCYILSIFMLTLSLCAFLSGILLASIS